MIESKIHFDSDYMEGCHPYILQKLIDTNLTQTIGYGNDEFCKSAREKIRSVCENNDINVEFMVGGTQTNATILKAILRPYESVISADTGHINGHEAGAVEATGHKIYTIQSDDGKISPIALKNFIKRFRVENPEREHVTSPAVVYISQPTELGTLYYLTELVAIRTICDEFGMKLFLDGARLGYGLVSSDNDVSLRDLARLCHAFYIGGTKVGALFGEAAVVKKDLIPYFRTIIKQDGALLAKGRLLGIQFDTLFTDNLYCEIAGNAIRTSEYLREAFRSKGYKIIGSSSTNQTFIEVTEEQYAKLSEMSTFTHWKLCDNGNHILRFITSWATKMSDVEKFVSIL